MRRERELQLADGLAELRLELEREHDIASVGGSQ
jgi:hypothetical protein